MYILNISYSQPPAAVQPHIPSHGAWVKQHIDDGSFLFAGPKKSGLGGIILTGAMPKPALLALLAQDSYVQADVVDYQVVEFDCKIAAHALQSLLATA
ncbi:MAG: YciI family protein [Collimonas sp.]|uniref:YciI family protein n=1 Tax=Collimonas sp. TaxID=1963772 RepID=UPI00326684D6